MSGVVSAAPPLQASASTRVRLARLAVRAALTVPGVLAAEAGRHPARVTPDEPAGLIRGAAVIAQAGGRYSVDLRLVARVVPLVALADEVRRRVAATARLEGLEHLLGTVDVEFARVLTDDEAGLER
jgi:hypothetical protein